MMNGQPLQLLLVTHDPAWDAALQQLLDQSDSPSFVVTRTRELREAEQILRGNVFALLLLDLELPEASGLAALAAIRRINPHLPVLVMTAPAQKELALEAVRAGAHDYVLKHATDGPLLGRMIGYAIERERAAGALRRSEEFIRLLTENVTDLVAVIDENGRRLYNSPSYRHLLGDPEALRGTNSFDEIHPEDRERVRQIFQATLTTGVGHAAAYRLVVKDGSVRHIESQGRVLADAAGKPHQVFVVSRDVTERKENVEVLRDALSDLKESHERLLATQRRLMQSERIEAVSTFAAGVAHEVRNPLQTILLGIDYLRQHVNVDDTPATATTVLEDMQRAVHRADAIIRGLLEFADQTKVEASAENLNELVEGALRAVQFEFLNYPVRVVRSLAEHLPSLRLDARTVKHVFINLFLCALPTVAEGGVVTVRSASRRLEESVWVQDSAMPHFKHGETVVAVEVEAAPVPRHAPAPPPEPTVPPGPAAPQTGCAVNILRKIVELRGGLLQAESLAAGAVRYTIMFKP